MVGGVAEQQLGAFGPLEVQVSRVLPGEADAAVDLNVLCRSVEVRLRAVALGERRDGRKFVVHLAGTPAGVVRSGLGRLDLKQHVGALVLDRLERADRATELHTDLGVLDRHIEAHLSATDLLGGERHSCEIKNGAEHVPTATVGSDEGASSTVKHDLGLLTGLVHGRQRRGGDAVTGRVHCEQRHTGIGVGSHDHEVRSVTVENVHLRPRDRMTVARGTGLSGDARLVPLAVLLGEGERGPSFTRRNAGEVGVLGVFVTTVQQGVGSEHAAREVGRAQQGTTHLFEHDHLLNEAEALTAVLFGNGERLQTHLFGHLAPDGFIKALLGLHLLTDRSLSRLVLEEAPDEVAQLVLLF